MFLALWKTLTRYKPARVPISLFGRINVQNVEKYIHKLKQKKPQLFLSEFVYAKYWCYTYAKIIHPHGSCGISIFWSNNTMTLDWRCTWPHSVTHPQPTGLYLHENFLKPWFTSNLTLLWVYEFCFGEFPFPAFLSAAEQQTLAYIAIFKRIISSPDSEKVKSCHWDFQQ